MQNPTNTISAMRQGGVPRNVGLLVDSVGSYGRGVIAGFASYARQVGWNIRFRPTWRFDPSRKDEAVTHFDGLLVQVTSRQSEAKLIDSGIPAVNVSNFFLNPRMTSVLPDDHAVGRLAAESFLLRSYTRFAFYGPADTGFARERLDAFRTAIGLDAQFSSCNPQTHSVERWLKALRLPVAVFACNDHFALDLLNHCDRAGIAVPSSLAVLGVDNDQLFASLSDPTLSSIMLPTHEIGQIAAKWLEKLMSGKKPQAMTRLPPAGVVSRGSTAFIPTADELVRQICDYLAASFTRPVQVNELAVRFSVSQRTIERRFRAAVGRTVLDELHRLRIEEAKRLLLAGGMTIKQVALRSGYTDFSRFSQYFKRQTHTTPTQFMRSPN